MASLGSFISPKVPGYWSMPQTIFSFMSLSSSPTIISKPNGSALVLITSIVCGWQFFDTNTFLVSDFDNL